jgi:hypothetical protein
VSFRSAAAWGSTLSAAALMLCVIVGWMTFPTSPARPTSAFEGPVLVLGEPWAPSTNEEQAIHLALSSLPSNKRREVLNGFERLADDIELRTNPLVPILDDEPVDHALQDALPHLLPVWTAARTLAAGSWATRDQSLTVRVADACPPSLLSNRCVPAFGESGVSEARRARFLAWPLTSAIRLESEGAAAHRKMGDALRARVLLPKSTVALVVDGRSVPTEDRTQVRRDATRIVRPVCRTGSKFCGFLHFAAFDAPARPLGFSLRRNEILVVPRLSSLARRDTFRSEVASLLAELPEGAVREWE